MKRFLSETKQLLKNSKFIFGWKGVHFCVLAMKSSRHQQLASREPYRCPSHWPSLIDEDGLLPKSWTYHYSFFVSILCNTMFLTYYAVLENRWPILPYFLCQQLQMRQNLSQDYYLQSYLICLIRLLFRIRSYLPNVHGIMSVVCQ